MEDDDLDASLVGAAASSPRGVDGIPSLLPLLIIPPFSSSSSLALGKGGGEMEIEGLGGGGGEKRPGISLLSALSVRENALAVLEQFAQSYSHDNMKVMRQNRASVGSWLASEDHALSLVKAAIGMSPLEVGDVWGMVRNDLGQWLGPKNSEEKGSKRLGRAILLLAMYTVLLGQEGSEGQNVSIELNHLIFMIQQKWNANQRSLFRGLIHFSFDMTINNSDSAENKGQVRFIVGYRTI